MQGETSSQPPIPDYMLQQRKMIEQAISHNFDSLLHTEQFKYEAQDFENIPIIIPKMMTYISKQVLGVVTHVSNQMKQIQAIEVKKVLDERTEDLQKQIDQLKSQNKRLQKKIDDQEESLAQQNQTTRSRLQILIDERNQEAKECAQAVLDVDDDDLMFQQPKYDLSEEIQESADFNKPRAFSMKQIRNLFFYHLSRSNLQLSQNSLNAQLNTNKESITEIKEFNQQLTQKLGDQFEGVESKFNDFDLYITKILQDQQKRHQDLNQKHIKTGEKIKKLRQGIDEFTLFQDMISGKVDKLNSKLLKFNEINEQRFKDNNELMQARVNQVDTRVNITIEQIYKTETDMKEFCEDMITQAKNEIGLTLNTKMDNLIQDMNTSKQKQTETLNTGLSKAKTKISKIRSACASQFDSYDQTIEKVVKQVKVIQDTFQDWTNHVMKPTKMSEARLVSMEVRMNGEQDTRISQVSKINEVIKKLIFAIQQASLNVLNNKEIVPVSANKINMPQQGQLPNLLAGTPSAQKQQQQQQSNKKQKGLQQSQNQILNETTGPFGHPIDLLFLKRLMYLKSVIQQQPRSRQQTSDSVGKMRGSYNNNNNQSFDFDNNKLIQGNLNQPAKKRSASLLPSEMLQKKIKRKAHGVGGENLHNQTLPKIQTQPLNKPSNFVIESNLKKGKIQYYPTSNTSMKHQHQSFLTDTFTPSNHMEPKDMSVQAWGSDLPKQARNMPLEGIDMEKERARHFNMQPFVSANQNISKESEDPLYSPENF